MPSSSTKSPRSAASGGSNNNGGQGGSGSGSGFRLDRETLARLAALIAALGKSGVLLAARAYLGPAAAQASIETKAASTRTTAGFTTAELRLLGLALAKLAFEAGELALHNPTVSGDGPLPAWQLDDAGHPPALSLAHIVAARRAWSSRPQAATRTQTTSAPITFAGGAPRPSARSMRLSARTGYYAAQPSSSLAYSNPRTLETSRMARATAYAPARSRTGGCGCKSAASPPPAAPPTYSPCSGGLPPAPPAPEPPCSCGGGCTCHAAPAGKTYDSSECPTFAISCETKQALRECVKVALCDFARCATEALCPDGRYQPAPPEIDATTGQPVVDRTQNLIDCIGQLACSFLGCLPEALCPPPCPPPAAEPDCLPCDYAVEVRR